LVLSRGIQKQCGIEYLLPYLPKRIFDTVALDRTPDAFFYNSHMPMQRALLRALLNVVEEFSYPRLQM
jgi:hypothetical protein